MEGREQKKARQRLVGYTSHSRDRLPVASNVGILWESYRHKEGDR